MTAVQKQQALTDLIRQALVLLRKEKELGENNQEQSEYCMNKKTIDCAFASGCPCSQLDLVTIRLTLIDSMYSTNLQMRPYGIGELAEAIASLGSDATLRKALLSLLNTFNLTPFTINKALFRFYKGGQSTPNNLFSAYYGTEQGCQSEKKALSLITKYAYFLTNHNFPIYDSLVKGVYPRFWNVLSPGKQAPKLNDNIVDYIKAINDLRLIIGNSITYDELDNILWHVGKIDKAKKNGARITLILPMNDYLAVKGDVKTLCNSPAILSKNPIIDVYCKIASII